MPDQGSRASAVGFSNSKTHKVTPRCGMRLLLRTLNMNINDFQLDI